MNWAAVSAIAECFAAAGVCMGAVKLILIAGRLVEKVERHDKAIDRLESRVFDGRLVQVKN